MGFTSANDILNNVGDKLESCDSKEKAMRVFNKYRNIISFSKDSTLQLTNIPDIYSYIVNKDGLVKIGKSLYKFTRNKEFIILNGEKSKISLLKSSQETDLKKGIIAFNLKPASNFSRIPLNYGLLIDTMTHTSNRRAYYQLEYENILQPVWSPNVVLLGFNIGSSTYLHLWGTKHNIFGWRKYSTTFHIDDLSFDVYCPQTGDFNVKDYPFFITDETRDYYNTFLASTIYVTKDDFYSGNYTTPVLDISMHLKATSRGVAYDTVDVSYY